MLAWLPGMSARDAAQREINYGQLNDRGTGIVDDGYNWQDSIGGFLGGYSKEDVEREAQKIRDKKLDRIYGGKGLNTRTELEGFGQKSSYSGVSGKTEAEIEAAQTSDAARLKAITNNLGIEDYDPANLSPTATVTQIIQSGTKKKTENKEAAETKAETKEQNLYDRGIQRQDELYDRGIQRQDEIYERESLRQDRKDERARLDRLEDRRLSAEQNKMQMQLSYDRLAMQERANMQARKDKAIAMLFQGLGNLGAGFAI